MTDRGQRRSQSIKPTATRCRGSFICRQKDGYKLITMLVSLLTPDEQSMVITCDCGFTFTEEAERIPSGPLRTAVDLYQFAVTDGTEIELTVRSPQGECRARYIVCPANIQEHSLSFWLDLVESRQSQETTKLPDERETGGNDEAISQH